jgi:hypothetical protein
MTEGVPTNNPRLMVQQPTSALKQELKEELSVENAVTVAQTPKIKY